MSSQNRPWPVSGIAQDAEESAFRDPGSSRGGRDVRDDGGRRHPKRDRISIREAFAGTRLWIFDLDNTLYPADCNLFAEIDRRMAAFIAARLGIGADQARIVQKQLYYAHGTTLSGLMAEHGVLPGDFLDFVHDIDLSAVVPAPGLAAALRSLPGRKFIFTNGSKAHAERVAAKLGVATAFDGIFDTAACGYVPKPKAEAFRSFLDFCCGNAGEAAMFDDLPHNLETAHALGFTTVLAQSSLVDHPSQRALAELGHLPDYIDFETGDLPDFLNGIIVSLACD